MSSQSISGVIFDLDGVITQTAKVHARAWKAMFDSFLKEYSQTHNTSFQEFTYEGDYLTYVDGKPRYEGVASFLESRGIHLEQGTPDDDPSQETVCGLGNRKNNFFRDVLKNEGVDVYDSTVRLIKELIAAGVMVGVASSSKNCQVVLQTAELENLFETRVDGVVSAELSLAGKPKGDIFVKAAENLGVHPKDSVVVEDAISGVQAGRNGQFGLVIGLAREDNEQSLKKAGADVVIKDFEGYTLDDLNTWFEEARR
jgi:beta-phosphoglucomutase family hydrolase